MRNATFPLQYWQTQFARLLTVNNLLQLVGIVGGLVGNYLINDGKIGGFVLWIFSNGALIALQARTRLYGLVALHSVYLYLCFQGIARWSARAPGTLPDWLVAVAHWIA